MQTRSSLFDHQVNSKSQQKRESAKVVVSMFVV
jgi:hypothetical protein